MLTMQGIPRSLNAVGSSIPVLCCCAVADWLGVVCCCVLWSARPEKNDHGRMTQVQRAGGMTQIDELIDR